MQRRALTHGGAPKGGRARNRLVLWIAPAAIVAAGAWLFSRGGVEDHARAVEAGGAARTDAPPPELLPERPAARLPIPGPPPAESVRVRVVGLPRGGPLEGARMAWVAPGGRGETATDAEGFAELGEVPASPLVLRAEATGRYPACRVVTGDEGEIRIGLFGRRRVRLEVARQSGEPATGVGVALLAPPRDAASLRLRGAAAEWAARWERCSREIEEGWNRLADAIDDPTTFRDVVGAIEIGALSMGDPSLGGVAEALSLSGVTDEVGAWETEAPAVGGMRWMLSPGWVVRSIEPEGAEADPSWLSGEFPAGGPARGRAVVLTRTAIVGRIPLGPDPVGDPLVQFMRRSGSPETGLVSIGTGAEARAQVEADGSFEIAPVEPGAGWVEAFWEEGGDPKTQEFFIAAVAVEVAEGEVADVGVLPVEGSPPQRVRIAFRLPDGEPLEPAQVLSDSAPRVHALLSYASGPALTRHFTSALSVDLRRSMLLWGLYPGNWRLLLPRLDPGMFRAGYRERRTGRFLDVRWTAGGDAPEIELAVPVERVVPLIVEATGAGGWGKYRVYLLPLADGALVADRVPYERNLRVGDDGTGKARLDVPPGEYELLIAPSQAMPELSRCALTRCTVPDEPPPSGAVTVAVTLVEGDVAEVRGPANSFQVGMLRRHSVLESPPSAWFAETGPDGRGIVRGIPPGEELVFGESPGERFEVVGPHAPPPGNAATSKEDR